MRALARFCAGWLALLPLIASEHHGAVKFGGLPVPGATITAVRGETKFIAITDSQGAYSFADLPDGDWKFQIEMLGFATINSEVPVASSAPAAEWDLKMLPFSEISAKAPPPPPVTSSGVPPAAAPQAEIKKAGAFQRTDLSTRNPKAPGAAATPPPPDDTPAELSQRAADGFLINGSVNNSASSPFALGAAFGNGRKGPRSLYNGSLGVILGESTFDARPYSLTGQETPKQSYSRWQGVATFGGPIKIPHLIRNGPTIFVAYQWTRNGTASTQTALVPTLLQRAGDLSQSAAQVIDPSTGQPFPGNIIPPSRVTDQSRAFLNLFPFPNFFGTSRYNYQVPLVSGMHQDAIQARFNHNLNRMNQLSGTFGYQSTRSDTTNLFGFLDTGNITGVTAALNWRHSFGQRVYSNVGFQYSYLSTRVNPYYANRENFSGNAGITGNNQQPENWGPPALNFSGGITSLSDSQSSFNRNQTGTLSYFIFWNRTPHNISIGADYKHQQFNYLTQQDPRGAFTFTGAAAGNDFAGFLLGIPDTSSIAFGNADKYFRAPAYDAYFTDDWRISPGLTVNAGMRWEYGAPITELYGRLVNLDIAGRYAAATPVVASQPTGSLTRQTYPDSLIQPDKNGFQPRIGISWRPFPASSMVVRGGYGLYFNTSIYQPIASQMAQQYPLSKSQNVQNSVATPLTLANGFNSIVATPNTFAVDPNFRAGYAHNWNLLVQRDLPGSLVMTATYLGIKGTRGMQEFLPNTYPTGVANPCPTCPTGFIYLTSNGNSTRESGQIQLRRRLHNGITASVDYTYSKSIDDSALGGKGQASYVVAQDWLNLSAERGLSIFDQRHLVTILAQYTSGMGIRGGSLMSGWRGAVLKEWTFATQINAGSGLPLTPVYPFAVHGTGVTGSIRPDYTGAALYNAPSGLYLNPAAYTGPQSGQWGNAGRNSIIGPSQFTLNALISRTFRVNDRVTADFRVDATNALNHVTFPSWNTVVSSAQFGLPNTANPMRTFQMTLRARF